MGFNDAGSIISIAPGQVLGVGYSWADGGDRGAQFAMAETKTFNTVLYCSGQAKQRDARGRVSYSVVVRNDAPIASSFLLQGGGFGENAFNDNGSIGTIKPGEVQPFTWHFGIGQDRGTQFFAADVKTDGADLIAFDHGKEIVSGSGVVYTFGIRNQGPVVAAFNLQGGGVSVNGFNDVGNLVSVAPGEVIDYQFNFISTETFHTDHGAQFATPDVKNRDVLLVATEHGKELIPEQRTIPGLPPSPGVSYHVKIRNDGRIAGICNVQGGGLS